MSKPFRDLGDTLFADRSVLTEKYQPEEILERDDEIDEYQYALQGILYGRHPDNIMLYGKAGLGKTAVTKYMMASLQEAVEKRDDLDDLHVHEQNCNSKTLFAVVRRLVNNLLPEHASEFPKRGLGTSDAFEELYTQLDRVGGTHLLIFDEIDHLSLEDINTLLYELPRAESNGYLTNSMVGIVGISNNYTFRRSLSAKVKDTLMETEISFSSYDAGELRTILSNRAKQAFADGCCDESAIAMAAAISAKDRGNARQAIDLLRVGADIAEKADDSCVQDNHIEDAKELVQRGRLTNRIRDQTQHAQYILETVAHLENTGETPARSKMIKTHYEQIADSYGSDPLTTLKSVQDHLSDLHMLGFLRRYGHNQGEGGGRYFEYELDLEADIIIDTVQEIEMN